MYLCDELQTQYYVSIASGHQVHITETDISADISDQVESESRPSRSSSNNNI